jgi:hypothetical protein
MTKGPKKQSRRNATIVKLYNEGVTFPEIARRFQLVPSRIRQIIARDCPLEKRLVQLRHRYGAHPDFALLADKTPIDVLILHPTKMQGWQARVLRLRSAGSSLKTIGALRRKSDKELLQEPKVGPQLLNELRLICPFRAYRETQ